MNFVSTYTTAVILGVLFGFFSRLIMLKTDYRQYPTYPHGRVIHISLGLIAAGLGSVAVPALLKQDYTAITFLGLAAQQFRDVRNMERNTLTELDKMELVPRGATYIEGIAMVFEGRNYLVIFTSFVTALASVLFTWKVGILVGTLALLIDKLFMGGKKLGDIVDIKHEEVRIDGPNIYVGDIYIMNIGLVDSREKIKEHALGFIITPKNKNSVATIANLGQRQAILHDVSTILGVYRDTGEPSLVPLAKRDLSTGRLGVFLLPQERDIQKAIEIIGKIPVLESAVRLPGETSVQGGEE
ncbi:YIEGIA family protein [Microaerobacter geothermalis]|uniref:YIEGIA family protein n=1 Tax=Microaerobacter geothermalis TaxID=674972 RepID=UPI001F3BA4B4|nr:YIEGIA family protein [Microaerobacter geothermalis]MCF6093525.1 YIEGIA family protein [Microaerobacter geothermalis]